MCTCSYASVAGHVGASRLRMDHADGNLHNYSPNRYLSIWHLRTLDMTWSRGVPCTTASNARSTLKRLNEQDITTFTISGGHTCPNLPINQLPGYRGWITLVYEQTGRNFFKVISIIYFFTCTWSRISLQVGLYRVIALAFWAGAWFGEFGVLWIVNTSIFLLESLMNMIMIIFSMPWQVR